MNIQRKPYEHQLKPQDFKFRILKPHEFKMLKPHQLRVLKLYELKIFELRGQVEAEAKNLQNIQESKEFSFREVQALSEKKSRLKDVIDRMEEQIGDKEGVFKGIIEKKTGFLESAKHELKDEKNRLMKVQRVFQKTTEDLENLTRVANELRKFVIESSQIRAIYPEESRKLQKARDEYQKTISLTEKEKEEAQREKKEADEMKEYVNNLYGKLATYTKVAKETLEYVNKSLKETGVPIHFDVPHIKLNIDNFNEQT